MYPTKDIYPEYIFKIQNLTIRKKENPVENEQRS